MITLKTVAKVVGLIFVFYVLMHWMTAGQDEIIEGPPEIPDTSLHQPSKTP